MGRSGRKEKGEDGRGEEGGRRESLGGVFFGRREGEKEEGFGELIAYELQGEGGREEGQENKKNHSEGVLAVPLESVLRCVCVFFCSVSRVLVRDGRKPFTSTLVWKRFRTFSGILPGIYMFMFISRFTDRRIMGFVSG